MPSTEKQADWLIRNVKRVFLIQLVSFFALISVFGLAAYEIYTRHKNLIYIEEDPYSVAWMQESLERQTIETLEKVILVATGKSSRPLSQIEHNLLSNITIGPDITKPKSDEDQHKSILLAKSILEKKKWEEK